jgi:dTDP-4-amino-4,6-dideoxygalactose transaminase
VPAHCLPAYHLYYLLLPSLRQRDGLIEHLSRQGVLSIFHYLPLHASAMGRRFGGRAGDCPVTESISERLVRLPLYNSMTPEEQTIVLEAVQSFRP